MKKPDLKKLVSYFGGAGFYIVLLLCVAAVGVTGWFFLFRADDDAQSPDYAATAGDAELTVPDDDINAEMPEEPVQDDEPYSQVVEITSDDTKSFSPLIVAPVSGEIITSFSVTDLLYSPTMNDWRTHDGVDIAVDVGTKVRACHGGTVVDVVDDYWMGTCVTIDHGDGTESVYANLQTKPTVSAGDTVNAGDIIGSVGNTACVEAAIEPHLHFAVMNGGEYIDPETYLAG